MLINSYKSPPSSLPPECKNDQITKNDFNTTDLFKLCSFFFNAFYTFIFLFKWWRYIGIPLSPISLNSLSPFLFWKALFQVGVFCIDAANGMMELKRNKIIESALIFVCGYNFKEQQKKQRKKLNQDVNFSTISEFEMKQNFIWAAYMFIKKFAWKIEKMVSNQASRKTNKQWTDTINKNTGKYSKVSFDLTRLG